MEKWCIENQLEYIEGTRNSSKRSSRNIDFTFTNFPGVVGETLEFGSSDHWPLVYKSDHIIFEAVNNFEVIRWKHYELILNLSQDYWRKQK